MSIVSSYFSIRSTALGVNPQVASLMDNLCAIGFGLGVRFVIGVVSHHDLKVTGTLVGLWEGVVMQHFLRKMPTSFDPYVAYGVRLFIDFLVTESLARLVLVLVWTGMGVIFADIAPALWIDAGLRRIWRRFRRDLYLMSRSMPSVPYPRTRTVRFSPSQTASVISSVPPSVFTTVNQEPTLLSVPTPTLRKRHVPGAFPGDVSETETDIGSVLGLRDAPSESSTAPRTQRRFTSFMRHEFDIATETDISSDVNDLDEENLSSSASSDSTEAPDLSAMNPSEIPDYDEEEEVAMMEKQPEESDRELTPKQNFALLPTPPDSFALHHHDEPDGVQPPPEVPIMPDEDWEEISRREASPTPPFATKDLPPTPPAKDDPAIGTSSFSPLPQQVRPTNDMPSTSSTQQPTREDNAAHPNDRLIDFTDDSPTSSQQQQHQQQQPLSDPSRAPVPPPPRFSVEFGDNFSYRQPGSPPPPFQDIYGQDEANWNDSGTTITPIKPTTAGDQTATNNTASNSNDNPPKKPNQNDTGDANKENATTAAEVGAQDGNDQAQASSSTTPQIRPDALNKGKGKDTNGNGDTGTAKRQRNKSRSGQSTPKVESKPASDDEGGNMPGTGPKQQGKTAQGTSTAWGKRTGGNGKDGDKDLNVGDGGAKRQSSSVADDADKDNTKTGAEAQQQNSTPSTSTAWGKRSSFIGLNPADKGTADDKTGNTAGNNPEQQVELAQAKLPSTVDATKRRSVTFDQGAADSKSGISRETAGQGGQGTGTGDSPKADPSLENSDKAKADNTNADRVNLSPERSPQNEQAESGPSIIPKPNPMASPSPSSSEKSVLPETSSDRLRQALELRKQYIALDKKIPKPERQHEGAVSKGDPKASTKKEELDAAVKEKEVLSKKIMRRLVGAYSEYLC
jgi:hypothetical protein